MILDVFLVTVGWLLVFGLFPRAPWYGRGGASWGWPGYILALGLWGALVFELADLGRL